MKKNLFLSVILAIMLLAGPVFAGNTSGYMTSDQKAALDGANSPSSANPLATRDDVSGLDTGVQTATAGVNMSNSGTAKNPIFDLDIDEDVDFGGYKATDMGDATNPTDGVNLQTMLNTYGIILNYWLMPSNSLGLDLTESVAYDSDVITGTPQTLTNIYFKSTVADTPTPFVVKNGAIIQVHFEAKVASVSGTKPVTLHAELYYVDSDGTTSPQQIGTDSDETATLTETKTAYYTHIHADTDIIVPAGKRLWLKYVATTTGATNNPTVWVYNGSINGHIGIGVSSTILGRYLLKAGGTMTGDIDFDGSYQVVGLQAPAGNGEAIRQTAKITESKLEDADDKKHTQGTDTALGAMAENIDLNGFKAVNSDEATADSELMTKWGVDQLLAGKENTITTLTYDHGGTGQSSYVKGDIVHATANNVLGKLGIGSDNQVLVVATDIANWETLSSALLSDVASIGMLDETEAMLAKWDFSSYPLVDADLSLADSAAHYHNSELGLQGGTSNEYYHMTSAKYAIVDASAADSYLDVDQKSYIDQDVTSGSTPTFSADNFSDGGSNAIITTTQETNFETAYSNRITSITAPLDLTTQTLSMSNVDNSATDGYLTHEQFAILEDKYTQAEADQLFANKLFNDQADTAVQLWMTDGVFTDTVTEYTPGAGITFSNKINLKGDAYTDRWLLSDTNTFFGVGVAGAGNLAHDTGYEGWNNTGFGNNVLNSIATGDFNTAFGTNALFSNQSGRTNTAFGMGTLYHATESYNTAVGGSALYNCTTGGGNTALGCGTLHGVTEGEYNTGLGDNSGHGLTTGSWNIYIGYNAGYWDGSSADNSVLTDDHGILIGMEASRSVASANKLTNYIGIGYRALIDKSNQVKLGNPSIVETRLFGKVGIDRADPIYNLDINGNNIGLGSTSPTDPHQHAKQIFLGDRGNVFGTAAALGIFGLLVSDNSYIDLDTGNYAYILTGPATQIHQDTGVITFQSAPYGAAGDPFSWTTRMTIRADGVVVIPGGNDVSGEAIHDTTTFNEVMRLTPKAAVPPEPSEGWMYWDSTVEDSGLKVYFGGAWEKVSLE